MYRVVVADNEPEFRDWLRSVLEASEDFRVVGEGSSGREAVSLIASLLPDLVIADMYMPDPDGLGVARYVQENCPNTKAIIVSAYQERVYEQLARDEGALAFIPKAAFSLKAVREVLKAEA
jgi:YesN/AraC family two-component response regulator